MSNVILLSSQKRSRMPVTMARVLASSPSSGSSKNTNLGSIARAGAMLTRFRTPNERWAGSAWWSAAWTRGSTSALLDFGAVQSEQICVVPQGQRYVREGAQIREQAPSSKTNPRRTPCLMSSLGVLAFGSWPSRRTEPMVAGTRPAHRYSSVDFPTPLSPVTMSELPRGHVKRGLAPWSPIQPGEAKMLSSSARRGASSLLRGLRPSGRRARTTAQPGPFHQAFHALRRAACG